MAWIGMLLLILAAVWRMYFSWLRHRPHNLTRGTQHLEMAGSCGCTVAMLAGLGFLIAAVHKIKTERERQG